MPFRCKQAGHNVSKYDLILFSIQETYTIMQGHFEHKAYHKTYFFIFLLIILGRHYWP